MKEEACTSETPTTLPVCTWCKDTRRESPSMMNLRGNVLSGTMYLNYLVLTLIAQDMYKYKYVHLKK
jgi:hypothetical protein